MAMHDASVLLIVFMRKEGCDSSLFLFNHHDIFKKSEMIRTLLVYR